jgi:hypothetical protein
LLRRYLGLQAWAAALFCKRVCKRVAGLLVDLVRCGVLHDIKPAV